MKITSIERSIEVILVLWFVIAMYLQQNIGLADNGDFSRAMGWISTGPVGIEPNWPAANTEDWSRRFFNFWIPYWKLEPNTTSIPKTSAFLLWLPGALMNIFLYSNNVLYLPSLSLLPKLLLFGMLLLLFKWIRLETSYRIVFLLGLGVPIDLLFTSTDYLVYLNTFYQESGSFVFLFLLLASILLLRRRPSLFYFLCSLAFALLLVTSKFSNLYWLPLGIPFIFYSWYSKKGIRLRATVVLFSNIALITLLSLVPALIIKSGTTQADVNRYHSLFYGALTFSDRPRAHLQYLGMSDDAVQCVNFSAFSSIGSSCFAKYQSQMSFYNTVRVIYREPIVMFRMLTYVLDNMQDISLDYLGKYSFDDPRGKTSHPVKNGVETRFWSSATEGVLLSLWAKLKFGFFPKGYALAFTLIGFVIWFTLGLKRTGIYQDLACVGLLSTVACIADMTVAILGDGRHELIKHLFLSNLLFDIGVIIFLSTLLISCLELVKTKLKSNSQKLVAA